MILVKIYDYSLSTLAVLQALTNSDDKTMVTATTATFLYDFFLQKEWFSSILPVGFTESGGE
jgi:hypothetical protein